MTTAKVSVSKVASQPVRRASQYLDGAKNGMLKETTNTIVNRFAVPMAARIQPFLNGLHPGLQLLEDEILTLARFGLITAAAEIIAMGGAALAAIPGIGFTKEEAIEKCQAIAEYMREYAGEQLGMKVAELGAKVIPLAADLLKNMNVQDLLAGAEVKQEQEQTEPATHVA